MMNWQKYILKLINERKDKKIALVIDTSTNEVQTELVNNIVQLFQTLKPDAQLIQADFKIRSVDSVSEQPAIKWFSHGKSSYTEVLEWGAEEEIDTLFYITDVTGYFYEELEINYEVMWLVPDSFVPKVPFGKAIKVA